MSQKILNEEQLEGKIQEIALKLQSLEPLPHPSKKTPQVISSQLFYAEQPPNLPPLPIQHPDELTGQEAKKFEK